METVFTHFKVLYQHITMFPTANEDNYENIDQENRYPGRDSTTGPHQFEEVVTLHTTLRENHSLFLNLQTDAFSTAQVRPWKVSNGE
jgi:hypothetical protein